MTFLMLLVMAVAAVFGLGLAVVGLVEAPWQVLLMGLLAALYGLERQMFAGEASSGAIPHEPAGQGQPAAPPSAEAALVGAIAPQDSPPSAADECHELVYRGIRYRQQQQDTANIKEAASAAAEGIYRGQRWRR